VLLMGALALAEHIPLLAPVARHWPLTFLGLALFLFLRADETYPDSWVIRKMACQAKILGFDFGP